MPAEARLLDWHDLHQAAQVMRGALPLPAGLHPSELAPTCDVGTAGLMGASEWSWIKVGPALGLVAAKDGQSIAAIACHASGAKRLRGVLSRTVK